MKVKPINRAERHVMSAMSYLRRQLKAPNDYSKPINEAIHILIDCRFTIWVIASGTDKLPG